MDQKAGDVSKDCDQPGCSDKANYEVAMYIRSLCERHTYQSDGFIVKNLETRVYRSGVGHKQPVMVAETRQRFDSIKECAEAIGGTVQGVSRVLKGERAKHRGYTFIYL